MTPIDCVFVPDEVRIPTNRPLIAHGSFIFRRLATANFNTMPCPSNMWIRAPMPFPPDIWIRFVSSQVADTLKKAKAAQEKAGINWPMDKFFRTGWMDTVSFCRMDYRKLDHGWPWFPLVADVCPSKSIGQTHSRRVPFTNGNMSAVLCSLFSAWICDSRSFDIYGQPHRRSLLAPWAVCTRLELRVSKAIMSQSVGSLLDKPCRKRVHGKWRLGNEKNWWSELPRDRVCSISVSF